MNCISPRSHKWGRGWGRAISNCNCPGREPRRATNGRQLRHNAGCVAVAGSAQIGRYCLIGGGAGRSVAIASGAVIGTVVGGQIGSNQK